MCSHEISSDTLLFKLSNKDGANCPFLLDLFIFNAVIFNTFQHINAFCVSS